MKIIECPVNEKMPKKINFGCGNNLLNGYLNIDKSHIINTNGEPYWLAIGSLINPQVLPNDYFDFIEAKMVFEHIHLDVVPSVIYTMSCLLKEGGEVHVTVPNFEYFVDNYPSYSPEHTFDLLDLIFLREATFQLLDPMLSSENTSYRAHQSLWTPDMANFWFRNEGFEVRFFSTKKPILEFFAVKKDKFSMSLEV